MPVVAVVCAVVFIPWVVLWAWLSPLPASVQAQVDDAVDHGLAGVIVYVDQAGRAPRLYAGGWKDRADQKPSDPEALFKIASISKLYIATAAAKLIHAGQLTADDKLADRLPAAARRIANADRITIGMMLRHRSGIPNFTDQSGFDWSKRQTDPTDNLNLALNKPAVFEPDSDYRYSNTNYLLIGAILDDVLGYSHQRYIEEDILAPLGLTDTHSQLRQVDSQEVVSGYHHKIDANMRGLDYATPGGSMVATAQNVGAFLRALNEGSLLSDDEQSVYSSIYEYEHTGWVPGYQSIARYHGDLDAVVVQFVSATGGNSETMSSIVYERIVRILRERRHPSSADST